MTQKDHRPSNLPDVTSTMPERPFWLPEEDEIEWKEQGLRRPLITAALAVTLGLGGFLVWGFTADLDSAAVAAGKVIVDSRSKTITHLEGGILRRLLVQEGDHVEAGQALVELDDTRARADLAQLRGKRTGLLARLARLRAERDLKDKISFPLELLDDKSQMAKDVIAAEQRVFEKRREVYEGKIAYQHKEIEQYAAQVEANEAQLKANEDRQKLLEDRVNALTTLEKKGFTSRANLSEVQLELSELIGDGGELSADRARADKARQGAEVALLQAEQEWQSDIAKDILDGQLDLNTTNEQIISAKDILDRLVVHSPQAGIVYNIEMRTPGGVVEPGKAIMDIVPQNEKMLVEVKMNLTDIDAVRTGADARIRLTAYDQRSTQPLEGKVTYVAADQTFDQATQTAYFVVRAEVNPQALLNEPTVSLYPGMPADVLIVRRPRKAIDYLFEPITDSFHKAFRED